jgi:hypothetical protein
VQGHGHQNQARGLALPPAWGPFVRAYVARGQGPDLRCSSGTLGGAPREAERPTLENRAGAVTVGRKRGRPSSYTPELAALICRRLSDAESLRAICRDPGMPSAGAVLSWAATRPEFRRQYDLARELAVHTVADEVLELADGMWQRNSPDALQDTRREIDAKKWHLARMASKRR